MKYRPKIWSITWRYLILAFVLAAVVYAFTFGLFIGNDPETGRPFFIPWGFSQYFIVTLVPTVLIGFYILSITLYYYKIDDYSFSMFRYGKEFVFEYKNIEFIDTLQKVVLAICLVIKTESYLKHLLKSAQRLSLLRSSGRNTQKKDINYSNNYCK